MRPAPIRTRRICQRQMRGSVRALLVRHAADSPGCVWYRAGLWRVATLVATGPAYDGNAIRPHPEQDIAALERHSAAVAPMQIAKTRLRLRSAACGTLFRKPARFHAATRATDLQSRHDGSWGRFHRLRPIRRPGTSLRSALRSSGLRPESRCARLQEYRLASCSGSGQAPALFSIWTVKLFMRGREISKMCFAHEKHLVLRTIGDGFAVLHVRRQSVCRSSLISTGTMKCLMHVMQRNCVRRPSDHDRKLDLGFFTRTDTAVADCVRSEGVDDCSGLRDKLFIEYHSYSSAVGVAKAEN